MEQQIEKVKIIDVDVVIQKYNDANPKLKPMDRKELAKRLGVNTQVFSDWKNGRTPKLIYRILKLISIGKCKFDEIIVDPSE